MIAEPLRGLARPVAELRVLEGNPRRGDVKSVKRSLQRFGQRKPIVVRDDGTVIAGNHTLLAAIELGWTEIAVVGTDDDDATAKAYALADNRTSALGSFDMGDLAAMAAEVHTADPALLEAASFTEADLNAMLDDRKAPGKNDPDDVPETPADPVTKPGDLWQLGPHRLLCGDATNPDDLKRITDGLGEIGIVYTDPPYGISIVKGGSIGSSSGAKFRGMIGSGKITPTTVYMPVTGDDSAETAADAFRLLFAEYPRALHVWWGGNHYAASAGLSDSSCWLVWDKQNGDTDFADAELAWTNHTGAVRIFHHMWNGMLRASERGKRVHPTQKPVALAEWAFGVIDPKDERKTVLDVFGGSGSTLIAAQRTGRAAAIIETEAAYCDVICQRYAEHTGVKPVLESTGAPHDFVA